MGREGAGAVQEHDATMMLGMPGGSSVVSAGCHVDTGAGVTCDDHSSHQPPGPKKAGASTGHLHQPSPPLTSTICPLLQLAKYPHTLLRYPATIQHLPS